MSKNITYEQFEEFIKEYAKVGFSEYKTFHKYGNEDEWDEDGELSNYKDVLVLNVKDILEEV